MFLRPDTRLLVLAPHTDDAELGCGATIARALEEGVTYRTVIRGQAR